MNRTRAFEVNLFHLTNLFRRFPIALCFPHYFLRRAWAFGICARRGIIGSLALLVVCVMAFWMFVQLRHRLGVGAAPVESDHQRGLRHSNGSVPPVP